MDEQVLEDFLLDKIDGDNFVKNISAESNCKEGEFLVTTSHLLKVCELAIERKIDSAQMENISDFLIFSDYFHWNSEDNDGKIVEETLNDWSSPMLSFPINDLNLRLWREYLVTGMYKLPDFNFWNAHIERQKEICKKANAEWRPINPKHKIGISDNLDLQPIHGLRHPPERGTAGWYIWSGEFSSDIEFFKPIHAVHLLEQRPDLIKYLGLPPGYRFLIDDKGYEDIWEDKDLLNI